MTTATGVTLPPDLTALPGYSREDLAANAGGRLSATQARLLRRELLGRFAGLLVMAAFFGVWIGGWLHEGGFGLFAIIPACFLAVSVIFLVRDCLAVHAGRVDRLYGDAWAELVPDSEGPDDYYLHVAGRKLDTTQAVYKALLPGGPYRVYFLRLMNRVVAVAPEPGWRPSDRPASAPLKRRWRISLGF